MTTVTIETYIDAPVALCFDMARDVGVHQRTAAFSGEQLIAPGRLSGLLEEGDLLCFEGRHFGVRHRFTTRIVAMQPPHRFVDEMVSGTFRSMRHDHELNVSGTGTLMRDVLVWQSPLGVLGRIADGLFLRSHLERFVRTKQRNLKAIVEAVSRNRERV